MTLKETDGKELRYYSFSKVEAGEGVPAEKVGTIVGWVKKPVKVSVNVPSDINEILALGEEKILSLVQQAIIDKAKSEAGTAPEGSFSKGMVSAAVRALKASPQFRGMARSALRDAVMAWIASNEAIKAGFLAAFEGLRTAQDEDEDED